MSEAYVTVPWLQSNFWLNYNLSHLFDKNTQQNTMAKLLKSLPQAKRYLNGNSLSRGHLSARFDFIYAAEQAATYYYVNVVPQWSRFNSGNWQLLEGMVRDFARRSSKDFIVYTGIHGIAQLPDVNGTMRNLYLYAEENVRKIPIPRYFWIIIYDPDGKQGTAFVGINNPYVNSRAADFQNVTDISSQIQWPKGMKRDRDDTGVIFACTVSDLSLVVSNVPSLEVNGTLNI